MNKMTFFITLVFMTSALAQNKSQQDLINQVARPTSEQILENPSNLQRYGLNSGFSRADAFQESFAQLIVSLEKAFPGGTYAFLGRDMDLIADAVEAYYLSIGQKGRVQHIRFSTPSMRGATDASIAGLLSGLGLNIKKGPHKGPEFVMVDYTSFSDSSQSTLIANSVVDYMRSQGLSGSEIIRRFNVMTIEDGVDGSFDPLDSDTSSLNFKKKQAAAIEKQGRFGNIFTANVGDNSMAYASAWNDTYGPIQKEGNKYVTKPSRYFTTEIKSAVLSEIIEAIRFVTSARMKAKVSALAKIFKVTFAKPDPSKLPAIPEPNPNKDFAESLSVLKELPQRGEDEKTVKVRTMDDEKIRLSPNGVKVFQTLTDPVNAEASQYLEISLQTLVALYEEGKIGVRDFRRILIVVLNNVDKLSPTFNKMIEFYYKKSYPLEIFLGRDYERAQYSSLKNNAGLNYKKMISLPSTSKPSCRFSYSDINPR